jgi:putative SOS response-associated peptidase YedK
MCGRMTMRTDPSDLAEIFDAELRQPEAVALDELGPRYNVAPTQPIPVIVQRDDGRAFEMHRWGIVPSWSTSVASAGARYINARAETVATSPVFRNSFLRRRCIIPADGFYEWRRVGKLKQPFLIHTPVDAPLAFAGLWAPWKNPADGQWLLSATVVTTAANATVSELHNRMPVILDNEAWRLWLDPDVRDEGLLASLLVPADDALLELKPASPLVNNANNEGAALLVAPDAPAASDDEPALTLFG